MRASRLPKTDEKSRVNTIPMAVRRSEARPPRRYGSGARSSGLGVRSDAEREEGRGDLVFWWEARSELARASTQDEDDDSASFRTERN